MGPKVFFTYQKDADGNYTLKHYFTLEEFIARVKNSSPVHQSSRAKITQRVKNSATF